MEPASFLSFLAAADPGPWLARTRTARSHAQPQKSRRPGKDVLTAHQIEPKGHNLLTLVKFEKDQSSQDPFLRNK